MAAKLISDMVMYIFQLTIAIIIPLVLKQFFMYRNYHTTTVTTLP